MKRVLVIDDDAQIRRLLNLSLGIKNFEVFEAATGFEGLQQIKACHPDIILLDLNLPDRDGDTVLAELRAWSAIPVLILSVRQGEAGIVSLLNAGADDYLVKPFSTEELIARMNVALRRSRPQFDSPLFTSGLLTIDWGGRSVLVAGQAINLTPTEYSILSLLARQSGRIVTYDLLLKELWGANSQMEKASLRVHISALRRKLGDPGPNILITEPGIGLRLRQSD